jgi:hypothetical protein
MFYKDLIMSKVIVVASLVFALLSFSEAHAEFNLLVYGINASVEDFCVERSFTKKSAIDFCERVNKAPRNSIVYLDNKGVMKIRNDYFLHFYNLDAEVFADLGNYADTYRVKYHLVER